MSYCREQGFATNYRRPDALSQDDSPVIDAVFDALIWHHAQGGQPIDAILLLQPTNPIRYIRELEMAIQYFQQSRIPSLVSATPVVEHPYGIIEAEGAENWTFVKKPPDHVFRRQDYADKYYTIDGSFYLSTVDFLIEHNKFLVETRTKIYFLEKRCIDIDNPIDLLFAEALLQHYQVQRENK